MKILAAKVTAIGLALYGAGVGGLTLAHVCVLKFEEAREFVERKLTRVEVVERHVEEPRRGLGELVNVVAEEHGLPPLFLGALIVQESGEQLRPDRIRYEPRLASRFKCSPHETEMECRIYASSIGLTQVIWGLHRERCGLSNWSELTDPETSLQCGATILRECLDRRGKTLKNKGQLLRACLSEYNGDGTGRYAQEVINKLASIIAEQQLKIG